MGKLGILILALILCIAAAVPAQATKATKDTSKAVTTQVRARNGALYTLDKDGGGAYTPTNGGMGASSTKGDSDWLGEFTGWTWESYCDTLWGQYFQIPGAVWWGRCDHIGLHKPAYLEYKYVNLDQDGHIRSTGTEVYIRNHNTGEMFKYVTDGCNYRPDSGCTNIWGDMIEKAQKYTVHQWPGEVPCLVPPAAEPLPRLGPPSPEPAPKPGPKPRPIPGGAPVDAGTGPIGIQSHDCYHDHTFVFNGEEHALPSNLLIERRNGKAYFPAERHTLKLLGIDGWIGGDRSPVNPLPNEVLYLGRHDRVLATWPDFEGWTLRDVGDAVGKVGVYLTPDRNYYYFDMKRVVELLGGWMYDSTESSDGKIHIGFPEVKGSWYGTCVDMGFSAEKLKDCPIDQRVIGSTWEYYFKAPGHDPDAYDSIMKAQGLIWTAKLDPSHPPAGNAWLGMAITDYNAIGLKYENLDYDSYYGPMESFGLDLALMSLDVAVRLYGTGALGSLRTNPAQTVALSEEARAVGDDLMAGVSAGRADQIREFILENGLNIVEEGGEFKSLPVNVLGESTKQAGRIARVIPVPPNNPKVEGGFYNQAEIGGQPAPHFFEMDGKRYVLVFEYVLEKGEGAKDGLGRWLPGNGFGLPNNVTLLEVKAGYDSMVNRATGEFYDDVKTKNFLPPMVDRFRQDMFKGEALGIDSTWAFTQKVTRDAFVKALGKAYGGDFVRKYGGRAIVTSGKALVKPFESGDFPVRPNPTTPVPVPVPTPGPCPNGAQTSPMRPIPIPCSSVPSPKSSSGG